MDQAKLKAQTTEFLLRHGHAFDAYFIQVTLFSERLFTRNEEGRECDFPGKDEELEQVVSLHLREMDIRIVESH